MYNLAIWKGCIKSSAFGNFICTGTWAYGGRSQCFGNTGQDLNVIVFVVFLPFYP